MARKLIIIDATGKRLPDIEIGDEKITYDQNNMDCKIENPQTRDISCKVKLPVDNQNNAEQGV